MSPKKIAEWLGITLGACGVWFVLQKIIRYYSDLEASLNLTLSGWVFLITLLLVFSSLNFSLNYGWYKICQNLDIDVSPSVATKVYAQSQLAKYVPGNIFQFVGRQALMSAAGYPNVTVAKTTFLELMILSLTGCLFIIPVLLAQFSAVSAYVILATFTGVMFASLLVLKTITSSNWTKPFIGYFIFLTGTGILFLLILQYFLNDSITFAEMGLIISSYVVAWLFGLLTPGAPAGIGVREAVLIFLLKDTAPETIVLLSVVFSRLINVLADVIFFMLGCLITFKREA